MINLLPFIFLLLFNSGKSIDINNCNRLWGMSNTVGDIDIYKIDIYMCINDPYDIYKHSHQNTFIQDNLVEHKNISNKNNTNTQYNKTINNFTKFFNFTNFTYINNVTNYTDNLINDTNHTNNLSTSISPSSSSLIHSPSPSSLIHSPSPSSLIHSPSPSSLIHSPSPLLSPSLSPSPSSNIIKNETNNVTNDDLTEIELFKKEEKEEINKEEPVDGNNTPITVLIVLICVLIVMFSVFVIVYACKKYKQVEDEDTMNNYEDDTPRTKAKKIQELGWYKKTFKNELKKIDNLNIDQETDVKKQVAMDIARARQKFNRGRNKLKVTYQPKTIPVDSPKNTVIDINENARATPPIPMKQNVSQPLKNNISQPESKNDANGDLL